MIKISFYLDDLLKIVLCNTTHAAFEV